MGTIHAVSRLMYGLGVKHARFAYRGGNYTTGANAGLATLNAQNVRGSTSTTIGLRPASGIARRCVAMAAHPVHSRKDAQSTADAERAATRRADSTHREPCAPIQHGNL